MDWLWDWWIQPFTDYSLLREALVAGLLTTVCTSLVGTWVVIRGFSFFAESLGHGILPGVAVAAILGGSTLLGAGVAATAMIVGLHFLRRYSPLPSDIMVGLLVVSTLGLAVLILSRNSDTYRGDISRFLFGDVLGITQGDILQQVILAGVIIMVCLIFFRPLVASSYNVGMASLLGFRPRLVETGLLALLALAVVASFRVVGSLLVFAFLVAPPATAAVFAKRISAMMLGAIGFGALAVYLGLTFSYHWGLATSATMALCSSGIFYLSLAGATLWRRMISASAAKRMSNQANAAPGESWLSHQASDGPAG